MSCSATRSPARPPSTGGAAAAVQVLGGQWRDPYTGGTLTLTDLTTLTQAEAVQIDHLVPLAEAWRSGASSWTPSRRLLFANDEANLVAVSAAANTTKSDDDPGGGWLPQPAARCAYARAWIAVKTRYRLVIDPAEKTALAGILTRC